MFFNLAWRNSKRSRNENLIYFLTMVTAVAAFTLCFLSERRTLYAFKQP